MITSVLRVTGANLALPQQHRTSAQKAPTTPTRVPRLRVSASQLLPASTLPMRQPLASTRPTFAMQASSALLDPLKLGRMELYKRTPLSSIRISEVLALLVITAPKVLQERFYAHQATFARELKFRSRHSNVTWDTTVRLAQAIPTRFSAHLATIASLDQQSPFLAQLAPTLIAIDLKKRVTALPAQPTITAPTLEPHLSTQPTIFARVASLVRKVVCIVAQLFALSVTNVLSLALPL